MFATLSSSSTQRCRPAESSSIARAPKVLAVLATGLVLGVPAAVAAQTWTSRPVLPTDAREPMGCALGQTRVAAAQDPAARAKFSAALGACAPVPVMPAAVASPDPAPMPTLRRIDPDPATARLLAPEPAGETAPAPVMPAPVPVFPAQPVPRPESSRPEPVGPRPPAERPAAPRVQTTEPRSMARVREADGVLTAAAQRNDIDPLLLHAVAWVESRHRPEAVSPAGARGLMQVMPQTAARFGVQSESHLHDPALNVAAGAAYLKWLQGEFGNDLSLVLAAYNAGEGAVRRHGTRVPPYPETTAYVRDVLAAYRELSAGRAPEGMRR
jgi:soluble lytic murein transglycosylase-like protein